MNEPLLFDLPVIEIPTTIGEDKYILREASGDAACKYRNFITSCAKKVGDEMLVSGPIADSQPLLVSLCLFKLNKDDVPFTKPVNIDVVRALPERVVKALFDKIQGISPLDSEDVEDMDELLKEKAGVEKRIVDLETVKNSQSDTMDG